VMDSKKDMDVFVTTDLCLQYTHSQTRLRSKQSLILVLCDSFSLTLKNLVLLVLMSYRGSISIRGPFTVPHAVNLLS
jgi:hypothetical protein